MNRGDGKIQRAIVTWLQRFLDGGDVIGIAAGVYGVRTRDEVAKKQRVSVRRAINRLVEMGWVELAPYPSLHGFQNWRLTEKARHPTISAASAARAKTPR